LLHLSAPNRAGVAVPLSAFSTTRWINGPMQTIRYNGYPAMRIAGDAAPGRSTGEAMDEMERLAAQLPAGFAYEWTGVSREEKLSGAQASILVVPLGIIGALLGASLRGFPNDVYFKVGLITIMGLSAKNAVLIIEYAKD